MTKETGRKADANDCFDGKAIQRNRKRKQKTTQAENCSGCGQATTLVCFKADISSWQEFLEFESERNLFGEEIKNDSTIWKNSHRS